MEAKAGTGKTTTLKKLANMVPDKSILYLVYNKKNEREAKEEFPDNTDVMTTNAFCGKIINYMFKSRLAEWKTYTLIPAEWCIKYGENAKKFKSQLTGIIDRCKSHNCSPDNETLIK